MLKPNPKDGFTVLHVAAATNDVKLLDYVLENSPEPEAVNTRAIGGITPVQTACLNNNFDATNLLIERGASLGMLDDNNCSALSELVRTDNIELLKCVYKPQKKVSSASNVHGLLHHASSLEGSKCLRLLLNIGVSANELSNSVDRASALQFAVLADA